MRELKMKLFALDVAAGRKRLRINATCPGSVREAPHHLRRG